MAVGTLFTTLVSIGPLVGWLTQTVFVVKNIRSIHEGVWSPCSHQHSWRDLFQFSSVPLQNLCFTQPYNKNKKAELSQRWPRDAPYIRLPWTFSGVPDYHAHGYFSRRFNRFFFRLALWTCVQNLTFVALSIPEIIGGTQKIWSVCGYAHGYFCGNF